MTPRRRFLIDAAKIADGRAAAILREIERHPEWASLALATERSALLEAKLIAKLIRQLATDPYRGDPYAVAVARRDKRGDLYPGSDAGVPDAD